jgi:hypothetical protein
MASIQRRRGSKIWTAFVRDYAGHQHCLSTRQTEERIAWGPSEVLSETSLKHELPYPVWLTMTQAEVYASLPTLVLPAPVCRRAAADTGRRPADSPQFDRSSL